MCWWVSCRTCTNGRRSMRLFWIEYFRPCIIQEKRDEKFFVSLFYKFKNKSLYDDKRSFWGCLIASLYANWRCRWHIRGGCEHNTRKYIKQHQWIHFLLFVYLQLKSLSFATFVWQNQCLCGLSAQTILIRNIQILFRAETDDRYGRNTHVI